MEKYKRLVHAECNAICLSHCTDIYTHMSEVRMWPEGVRLMSKCWGQRFISLKVLTRMRMIQPKSVQVSIPNRTSIQTGSLRFMWYAWVSFFEDEWDYYLKKTTIYAACFMSPMYSNNYYSLCFCLCLWMLILTHWGASRKCQLSPTLSPRPDQPQEKVGFHLHLYMWYRRAGFQVPLYMWYACVWLMCVGYMCSVEVYLWPA